MSRYQLADYTDPFLPTIFVGVYNAEDIQAILDHKGFKVVMFCGADLANAEKLVNDKWISGFLSDMHIYEKELNDRLYVRKYATIPMKSFEEFNPIPLGEKIYFYARVKKPAIAAKFKMPLLEKVKREFGSNRVLIGYQGHTMEEMREKYYAKSFINLCFTREVGFTTALEMAHMGRKTISNYPCDFCVPYQDEKEIIGMIKAEEKRIGTVREDIAAAARRYYSGDDNWLNVDYWA